METKELVGLFVKGTLKNSSKFYGVVLEATDTMLTLTGRPGDSPANKKYVVVSEIAEFFAETFIEGGK